MSGEDVHARTQEGFSAYLDGELGGAQRQQLEAHVAGCIQCRTQLEQLRRTVGKLGALKQKAPPSFLTDIHKQINTRSGGRFFGRRWLLFGRIPFEWVSLTMIVAMLVYYIVSLAGSPTTVSPG
jgi:anti-sigma factor RsiW